MSWGSAFGEIILSNFVMATETPYSSPCKYDYPNDVPVGQKSVYHDRTYLRIDDL